MSAYWMWWIAAAALVAAELLTGTFYLLVVGVALAFGGVAAWFDASVPLQWLIAAALGVIGTVMLQRWKRNLAHRTPAQQGLDIGQMVQVQSWGPDGTARQTTAALTPSLGLTGSEGAGQLWGYVNAL